MTILGVSFPKLFVAEWDLQFFQPVFHKSGMGLQVVIYACHKVGGRKIGVYIARHVEETAGKGLAWMFWKIPFEE